MRGWKAFAYAIEDFGYSDGTLISRDQCALFGQGDIIEIGTKDSFRFLFVSGKPLNEPVSWGGPIVMNSNEELAKAFQELEEGTFIKDGRTVAHSRNFYRG